MSVERLREEVEFGLSNLNMVYDAIVRFASTDMDERVKTSAISYECIGYYNALEHLFIRFLKYIRGSVPSGQSSHRDILLAFEQLFALYKVECSSHTRDMIRNLMAFRHAATKIYGFLIDWGKLSVIVEEIRTTIGRSYN